MLSSADQQRVKNQRGVEMKRILNAVSIAALIFVVSAHSQTQAQKESETAKQELIKLENEWMTLGFKHDTASIEKLSKMQGDEIIMTFDGAIFSKAQILEFVKSRKEELLSFVINDWQVRVYRDAAVVMGRVTYKARSEGKEETAQNQFTDTWIKRDGRWQCVAAHNSTVAKK
jgi:hypothetical protein